MNIKFINGSGNLPMLQVDTGRSVAEIYLHGAHVTHFQKRDEAPLLWLSQKSRFDDKSAIRGGIPIIFPWFGGREGKAAHGYARVKNWELKEVTTEEKGAVKIHLRLPDCAEAAEFSAYTLDYFLTISDTLELHLSATNLSKDRDFVFEECLHSYFNIGDINSTEVIGLKNVSYMDKVGAVTERVQSSDPIIVTSEVDRVYQDTTATVEIHDKKLKRKIIVVKTGSASTVVWNPWVEKSKAMADFGEEEYHHMICVESGNVGKNKRILRPGENAVMTAKLSSVAL